jgi:hypothetical protein
MENVDIGGSQETPQHPQDSKRRLIRSIIRRSSGNAAPIPVPRRIFLTLPQA